MSGWAPEGRTATRQQTTHHAWREVRAAASAACTAHQHCPQLWVCLQQRGGERPRQAHTLQSPAPAKQIGAERSRRALGIGATEAGIGGSSERRPAQPWRL